MPWQDHAACRGVDGFLMPERVMKTRRMSLPAKYAREVDAARAVCNTCPVLDACRAWCLSEPEDPVPHHIAAGMTPQERAKKRRNATNSATFGPVARKHGVMATARTCTCWQCAERLQQYKRMKADAQAARRHQWREGGPCRIAHGTYSGYKQHQLADVPYCDPCREAYNAYQREYRLRQRKGLVNA